MNGEDRLSEGELSRDADVDVDRTDFAGRPGREWPRADRTGQGQGRSRGQREAEGEVATGRLAATLMLGLSVLAVVFAALAVWLMLT